MIFDKIIKIKGRKTYRIIGFDPFFLLALIMGSGMILTLLLIGFSFFFYPISFFSWEALGVLISAICISIFGFGYQVKITSTTFYFYTTYFFVPFLRIKENLENVILSESYFLEEGVGEGKLVLKWDDDPWGEMGFSDWVSIKKGNKEFCVGTNDNYEELLATIKNAIDLMKKNSSETL